MPYQYNHANYYDYYVTSPSRYWVNSKRTIDNFKESPNKRQSAHKASIWEDHDASKWKIAEMGVAQLRVAIKQLTDGWKCYGQEAKIISLKKALAKLDGTVDQSSTL